MEGREWIDCHVHVLEGGTRQVENLIRKQRQRGYIASNFLSVEGMGDAAQNALAIYYKLRDPHSYAFGSMHYRFAYDFGEEARKLHHIGLDGIKMIENKPAERKRLGYSQEDARYESLYLALEELDMPLLAHVGDPAEFWDKDRIPSWALAAGWYYGGEGYPGREQLLQETQGMLERHPGLRVCFAHFLFLAQDQDRLCEMMEKYPNMYLDLTAGTEMYFSFSQDIALWKSFFLKYRNRILFGTDNCNPGSEEEAHNMEVINRMERDFLRKEGRIAVWDKEVWGMGLPDSVWGRIAADNFRSFAGEKPRPIHCRAAADYLQERILDPRFGLSHMEREILRKVTDELLLFIRNI